MRNRVKKEVKRMQKYEELEAEVIRFEAVDIIKTSTTTPDDEFGN